MCGVGPFLLAHFSESLGNADDCRDPALLTNPFVTGKPGGLSDFVGVIDVILDELSCNCCVVTGTFSAPVG